ncbi:MAG TPA: c-type cytochrome [Candidatus Binataceae bacterium]|nr:c-type cytochrome [Candidatus Binataceae bacterium]
MRLSIIGWPPARIAKSAGVGLVLAASLAMSASAAFCFPWDIDMYRGPEVQPLAEAPRVTPADTLPVHGEPPLSLEQATIKMHNPLQPTAENLTTGKTLFETNCAPCHGSTGEGNGPVTKILIKPSKDLVAGASKSLPDGYIYGVITDGILTMPSYADSLPPDQRWQVVLYVRSLQQAAGKTAASGQ